jgi:hypothetical protein
MGIGINQCFAGQQEVTIQELQNEIIRLTLES